MRIAFFGTPDITLPILDALKDAGFLPAVIVTAPDRPIGRHATITPPPAKVWALAHNVPVIQPEKLDADFLSQLSNINCQLSVVVAYGKIIPESVITAPAFGTLNIHYSLLPKYRGASPVEAAILAGETATGVTIQQMVFKLDAGPVLAQQTIAIGDTETAPELLEKLNTAAAPMLVEIVKQFASCATVPATPQDNKFTTSCGKIKKEDGELVSTDTDDTKWRKYRAYFDWPGVFFFDTDNKRIKITKAEFAFSKFRILKVIPEGKKEMDYKNL